jgi:hypothetical protein
MWNYTPDSLADIFFIDLDVPTLFPPSGFFDALCTRCSDLDLLSPECHFTDTWGGLSGRTHCVLCRLLLSRCNKSQKGSDGHIVEFSKQGSYLTFSDEPGLPIVSLYKHPGMPLVFCTSIALQFVDRGQVQRSTRLASVQLGIPKIPGPSDPAYFKLLKEWIKDCDDTHACCPRNLTEYFFPTRIIDVGKVDSNAIMIKYDTWTRGGSHRPYVALSHRWGQPGEYQTICTNKAHIVGQTERTVEMADLPKTFQDAVVITRNLGVSYLWIDSLCVVQDDKDDWNRESKLMEDVYGSAYCTLAATCAKGTNDGFLKPTPARQIVTIEEPQSKTPFYLCDAIDDFYEDVDQSDLNKRAWVLQERALSRRTIHFAQSQTYWECGGGVRCGTLTKMTKYV